MFETIIKSLENSRPLKEHGMLYVKEILSRMQGNIKANAVPTEVAYGKGLLAYSQADYEGALNELEVFAGMIPGNTEVNYYIELLKKMLGKQPAKPQEKPSSGGASDKTGGNGDNGQKDEFPGLEDKAADQLLSSMSKEEYINYKLRGAVTDFNQARYDVSVKDCLYVLRVDPNRELGYVRLGSAYYALGLRDYAIKSWQKALQLNPNNADLREFMNEKNMPVK
jgi:tetratricopeptide (TPR) repeat protein